MEYIFILPPLLFSMLLAGLLIAGAFIGLLQLWPRKGNMEKSGFSEESGDRVLVDS